MAHRRTWLAAAGALGVATAALIFSSAETSDPLPATPDRAARAFVVQGLRPDLSPAQTQALLVRSDEVVGQLQEQGVEDVGAEVRACLAGAEPTEEQRRAFFAANRHLFGRRSYHESRWAVDQLVRIQLVRAELGMQRASPYHGAAPNPV